MCLPGPTWEHLRAGVWADWVWQRIPGSRQPGDPAHGSEAEALGRTQWPVMGNGLSCGRRRGRFRGNGVGCRPPEAHVGNGRTSALEALGPPVVTISRLRALHPMRGINPVSWCRAAQLQVPSKQP